MELIDIMSKRYSCRSFSDKRVSKDDLEMILRGGYLAPVGRGEYDNLLISVIENKELLSEVDRVGSKFFGGRVEKPTYSSSAVLLVSAKKSENQTVHYCNASCIIENMMLVATSLGIQSVYLLGAVEAVKKDNELCNKLGLGDEYSPVAAVALGYDTVENRQPKEKVIIKTNFLK